LSSLLISCAAYQFATDHGKVITLGAYGSVGVRGGFAQVGPRSLVHGDKLLSAVSGRRTWPSCPQHGLIVDNLLEFKLVVADGRFVTANTCKMQTSSLLFGVAEAELGELSVSWLSACPKRRTADTSSLRSFAAEVTYQVFPATQ
jgi:hypothetical protein